MSYAHSAETVFDNMLGTLDHLVGKAENAGMADTVLAEKLTEGMFPLELMAYALLRNAGLDVGKMDFLPHMKQHTVKNDAVG